MNVNDTVEIYLKNSNLKLSGIIDSIKDNILLLKSLENPQTCMWIPIENILMCKIYLKNKIVEEKKDLSVEAKSYQEKLRENSLKISELRKIQSQLEKEKIAEKFSQFEIGNETSKVGQYGPQNFLRAKQHSTEKTSLLAGRHAGQMFNLPRKKS